MSIQTNKGLKSFIVYGLGSIGQMVVNELLDAGVDVELILDRGKSGQVYRGIPIISLDQLVTTRLQSTIVILGLHNHYIDINKIYDDLTKYGVDRVITLTNFSEIFPTIKIKSHYWLDPNFDYSKHLDNFFQARELLSDDRSKEVFDSIIAYRRNGNVPDCPLPSLDDEYTPHDLPRFKGPLQIIDCGAFTGVAIHKFLKRGYEIDSFIAFEPDPNNFGTLVSRDFPIKRQISLPLGTWSTTRKMSFEVDSSMASCLSETGDTMIQCVAVDDILNGEAVNLVKMDVEGAEIETLIGMNKLIRKQKPYLLISAYHAPDHLYAIINLVASWNLDYNFFLRVHEYNTFGVVVYAFPSQD